MLVGGTSGNVTVERVRRAGVQLALPGRVKRELGAVAVVMGLLGSTARAAAPEESAGLRLGVTAGGAVFTMLTPIGVEPFERVDGVGGIAAVRAGVQFSSAAGLYLEPRLWFGTFEDEQMTGLHLGGVLEFAMGKYASFAFGPVVGQNRLAGESTSLGGMLIRLGIDLQRNRFYRRGAMGFSLYLEAQPMFYTSDVPIEYEDESLASFPSLGTHAAVALTLAWERR